MRDSAALVTETGVLESTQLSMMAGAIERLSNLQEYGDGKGSTTHENYFMVDYPPLWDSEIDTELCCPHCGYLDGVTFQNLLLPEEDDTDQMFEDSAVVSDETCSFCKCHYSWEGTIEGEIVKGEEDVSLFLDCYTTITASRFPACEA